MQLSAFLHHALLAVSLSGPSATSQQSDAPAILNVLPYLAIFALFYFILFAPVRKKQKKTQAMLQALKTGDRVVMTCGITGTIVGISGELVQLRIADKVKIDITKASIAGPQPEASGKEETK